MQFSFFQGVFGHMVNQRWFSRSIAPKSCKAILRTGGTADENDATSNTRIKADLQYGAHTDPMRRKQQPESWVVILTFPTSYDLLLSTLKMDPSHFWEYFEFNSPPKSTFMWAENTLVEIRWWWLRLFH